MNKLFAALLFFCVIGASVLWWLMKMLPDDTTPPAVHSQTAEHAENTEHGGTEHAAKDGAAEENSAESTRPVLHIDTIPQGAKVEIAGVYAGVTPVDVPLSDAKREALMALEGYEVYRREVPAQGASDGAELNWKITLKASASEVKASEVVAKKEMKNAWLHGSKGPYFIQIKAVKDSVGETAFGAEIVDYRKVLGSDKISGCLVNLGQRGKWFRVLAGPFGTRDEATKTRSAWMSRKPDIAESFVTGRQSCI